MIIPTLCAVFMARALGPPPEIAEFQACAKSYLFLLGGALLLGIDVAALQGPFILGPLSHYRAELNGYPFQPGDWVEILVGVNCGRVVQLIEAWDWRGDLRVDLGEFASLKARTFFQFTQVIMATEQPGTSVAADETKPR